MRDPWEPYTVGGRRRRVASLAIAGILVVVLLGGFSAWGLSESGLAARIETIVSQAKSAIVDQLEGIAGTLSGSSSSTANTPAASTRAVYPHVVPVEGAAITVPTQSFKFNGIAYSVTPEVNSAVYWGAKKAERSMSEQPGESHAAWVEAYYRFFVSDSAEQSIIDSASAQLRAIANKAGLDSDQYLELIAKYVQSIPYDTAKASAGGDAALFPVETIVEGKGVCSDKSILLAALLAHEGYAVALLDFPTEKHMAVGVLGSGSTYGDTGYLFLETTSPCYVTDVPAEYSGGMTLTSEPQIITIGTGRIVYGGAADIARIVQARSTAPAAAQALYASASKQKLSQAQAAEVNRKLQLAYNAALFLQSDVVDQKGNQISQFMDRVQAIQWLNQNDWWN